MIDNKYVSRLSKQLDKRLQIAVHFLAILSAVTVLTSSEWLIERNFVFRMYITGMYMLNSLRTSKTNCDSNRV